MTKHNIYDWFPFLVQAFSYFIFLLPLSLTELRWIIIIFLKKMFILRLGLSYGFGNPTKKKNLCEIGRRRLKM
jgi:hypothetical protein